MNFRKRLFEIIEKARPGDVLSKVFDLSVIVLILLNVAAVILESFKGLDSQVLWILSVFEWISVMVFTAEYLMRLWTAVYLYPESRFPMLRYIFSWMAVIDLLAILPFYMPFLISCDLRFLRMLRMFRILRVFKLNRYSAAMGMILKVLKNEKEKLITTVSFTTILLLFASVLMYYVENEAQPDKFPNIVESIWWAVATLTTVGYGDVYPVTPLGKILSGLIAILGIGLVALPTGILSSGFISEMGRKNEKTVCPHCGRVLGE